MTEACDPDADIETLRKAIKMQTGEELKLTRKEMCDAYNNISGGKLPLPPLVMTADRTYLVDRASPLKHLDYELLFDSTTKRNDLKRIARKVGLTSQIEQKTKKQLVDAISKRLRYMKIREPIKIVSKRLITKDVSNTGNNAAVNNTAVRNNTAVNNTAANNNRRNFNNNSAFNNTENRNSNFNNFNANKKNGFNNNNNRRNNNNSVNLSGNKNGLKFKTNQNTGTTSLNFPNKLKFKPSFVSSSTNSGSQTNASTNSGSQMSFNKIITPTQNKKPAFLTASTSTGTNAGPPPTQFSNGFKKKPSFLNKTNTPPVPSGSAIKGKPAFLNKSNAPAAAANGPKKPAFLNKGNAPAATANGPKKPGMFNWMFKKKNAAAAGAAGAAVGATAVAAGANGAKKCGMMNRMMGRCKKNGTVANKNGPNATTNNANKNGPNATTNNANKVVPNATTNNANKVVPNAGIGGNTLPPNKVNSGNGPKNNKDVNIVANQILNEINKDVNKAVVAGVNNKVNNQVNNKVNNQVNNKVNNKVNNRKLAKSITDGNNGILNQLLKRDITNSINKSNANTITNNSVNTKNNAKNLSTNNKAVVQNVTNGIINHILKKDITNSIQKYTPKPPNRLLSNTNRAPRAAYKKPNNNKKNNKNADVEYVANQILKQLQNDVAKEIRLGGRAAEPIYNNSSNSNNNKNKNKNKNKKTTQNNPLFEPNMQNNPLYSNNNKSNNNAKSNNNKNSFNGGPRLGANNNNVSLPPSKNVVNVNNVKVNINNVPKEVEQQENNVRNIIKNMNSERDKLKNKITKELNLIPNNNGVFQERTGLTKGRIGLWARELRAAETIDDLKAIENKLNAKVVLRRNIENKYTKAGLTKVEKMNHRRKVVKLLNNVNKRRSEIEMQIKNKKNNNNNKNSVISNYNSNANNNPNRAKKMKYKSRENFVEAKKVELRELAKKTSTNFGRNIDRMQTRQNVFKLRGRIKGAIKRDEGLSKIANNKK